MVCQLRPLMYSLGLNNTPCISFKLVKSRIKNIWRFKQEASRCKMTGAGFQCIAKLRALTPRNATIRITAWQSALNHTADCRLPLWSLIWTLRTVQTCDNPLSNVDSWSWQSAVWPFSLWQSAEYTPRSANTGLNIWARSLAMEWNPAPPPILHQETACLKCHIFLTRDFTSVKRAVQSLGLNYTSVVSVDKLSHDTIPLIYGREGRWPLCPPGISSPPKRSPEDLRGEATYEEFGGVSVTAGALFLQLKSFIMMGWGGGGHEVSTK
jgi:hypothetical protein